MLVIDFVDAMWMGSPRASTITQIFWGLLQRPYLRLELWCERSTSAFGVQWDAHGSVDLGGGAAAYGASSWHLSPPSALCLMELPDPLFAGSSFVCAAASAKGVTRSQSEYL